MSLEFEKYIKGCNLWTLRAMLAILEGRLGTIYEKPNDMERTRAIAHQINNLLTQRWNGLESVAARKSDLERLDGWVGVPEKAHKRG